MTIEQLLCPAVVTWELNYRKKLNESHITMTDDEIADEFDKWLVENEDLINKSVEENRDHINEVIKNGMNKARAIYEKLYDDEDFDDEGGNNTTGGNSNDDAEEEPLSGEVEGEEVDPDEPEQQRTLTGAIRLHNNRKSKYDIFGTINDWYDEIKENGACEMTHKGVMRHFDVTDVKDMTALFAFTNLPNLDLSSWNTENVKKMEGMFYKSTFNNDSICNWDVSSCSDFKNMFLFCPFNQSLASWTPAWVEKKIRNADGTEEKKSVRADLPILGGTEDEAKAMAKNFRRKMFKQFRDEEGEEFEESRNININNNKMNHVVDFDTFINEGKIRDFIDKGVKKIKEFFKTIPVKFGKLVAYFKENGDVLPVVSAYTSLNLVSTGQIPGVTAFCDVKNEYLDGVKSEASIVPSAEYYGIIKKDSLEYKNYEIFKSMINEHYEKYGDTAGLVDLNEDYRRVGLNAESGGVVVRDIDSSRLRQVLNQVVNRVPAYKGDNAMGAVLIWGAPGIGKSSIPKSIVNEWNEKKGDEFHKKALMIIECGDLTLDGFSLPIPIEKSIEEYLDERPVLKGEIEKMGVSTDTLETIKKTRFKVSTEAPKTWLPAYNKNATPEEVKIMNRIANGSQIIKETADGDVIKTETTEGGILLFDEFFRADSEVFKVLMQIIVKREYSGYRLGNKWGILACSNRPNDDEEVRKGYEKTGPVVGNRFLGGQYNFIPSFDEWKKWAVKYGGFDNLTLEFLMKDKNPQGEYINWHTIKPEEYTATGRSIWPTPRAWSGLMVNINDYIEENGLNSITEIPEEEIRFMADGVIGEEMSAKYANFIKTMSKQYKAIDVKAILEDPNYKIPEDMKVGEVTRQILNHIKTVYSYDELPDVKLLMNMFNNIDRTYSTSKDNFTKVMHVDIIKFFRATPKSANAAALKEYLKAVDARYDLDPADLK